MECQAMEALDLGLELPVLGSKAESVAFICLSRNALLRRDSPRSCLKLGLGLRTSLANKHFSCAIVKKFLSETLRRAVPAMHA